MFINSYNYLYFGLISELNFYKRRCLLNIYKYIMIMVKFKDFFIYLFVFIIF